jgi:hypothetical protein
MLHFGKRGRNSKFAPRVIKDFYLVIEVPNPLRLKCDTITSPRRLVNTFIHQMIPDLIKRDKSI